MKFIDANLDNQFNINGFCETDLLNPKEVSQLIQFAHLEIDLEKIKNTKYGMYVSMEEPTCKRTYIKNYLQDIIEPKLHSVLSEFKIHLGGYLIKVNDQTTFTYPHQDWTFVDNNTQEISATVWIPLYDIGIDDGTLGFIKGSHKFLDCVIGSPSPLVKTPAMGKHQLLLEYMKYYPMTAGTAVIFNNKTIHGALPNKGKMPRIAIGIGIVPKNSTLYHYYLNPINENELLKLKISEDFFMIYSNNDLKECYEKNAIPQNCELVGKINNYHLNFPDIDYINDLCLKYGNHKSKIDNINSNHSFKRDLIQSDSRTFFEKYSPSNIKKEIDNRWKKFMK